MITSETILKIRRKQHKTTTTPVIHCQGLPVSAFIQALTRRQYFPMPKVSSYTPITHILCFSVYKTELCKRCRSILRNKHTSILLFHTIFFYIPQNYKGEHRVSSILRSVLWKKSVSCTLINVVHSLTCS